MSAPRVPALVTLLVEASADLADVEVTQAYGYDAVSAGGRVFALVAHGGGIGVRLPDWDLFAAAFELPGSRPLYQDEQRIGHWVVLPAEVTEDDAALREWLRHAHALTAGRV